MISDYTIDEVTARYWCLFSNNEITQLLDKASTINNSNVDTIRKNLLGESISKNGKKILKENWFTDLLKSGPAWYDEPTGFNVEEHTPEKDAGWKEGVAIGAIAGAAALNPKLTGKVLKTAAKTAVKHPVATTAIGVGVGTATGRNTIRNVTRSIADEDTAKKVTDALEVISSEENDNKDLSWWQQGWNFITSHAGVVGTISSIIYILYKFRSLWFPYFQHIKYNIIKGQCISKCKFTADNEDYEILFDLKRYKWVLHYDKVFSQAVKNNEVENFIRSNFGQKFIKRSTELTETFMNDNIKKTNLTLLATTVDKDLGKNIINIFNNKQKILANMSGMKYSVE